MKMKQYKVIENNEHIYNLTVLFINKATAYKLYSTDNEKLIELIDDTKYFRFFFKKGEIQTHLTNELAIEHCLMKEMIVLYDYTDNITSRFQYQVL